MNTSATSSDNRHRPFETVAKVAKVLIPLAVSAGLVVWLFHKVDIAQIKEIIERGISWPYIIAMMVLTVLSHVIRGIRWGMQLRAVGIPRMSVTAESVSILGAYALNIVFPFLGEGWRCVYVSRTRNAKLSTVVGTDLGDRASDGIMIGMLIVLALIVAHPALVSFLDHYRFGEALNSFAENGYLWITIALVVVALVWLDRRFRTVPFVARFNAGCKRIWDGFVVLFHLKGMWLYIAFTIGIWTCYFLETYLCFYAFPFTRPLLEHGFGLVPGLVVFVFGSASMIVPSNGGLGPWNMAVIFALGLYGVGQADAAAYSIVCWSFQSIAQIAGGIFAAIYIMVQKHKF